VIQEVVKIRSVQKRVGTRKLHYLLEGFRAEHSIKKGRDLARDEQTRDNQYQAYHLNVTTFFRTTHDTRVAKFFKLPGIGRNLALRC
jgi:hypothetical protein